MAKGKLIVVEGPDGSGKTTLCNKLSDNIVLKANLKSIVYSLPNKQSFGYRKMRNLLTKVNTPTDLLQSIMIVNMKELLINQVKEALDSNINVILDRWLISTIIYNDLNNGKIIEEMTTINGNKKELILDKISSEFCNVPIYPDVIIFLDLPKEILINHAKNRNGKEINDKIENVEKIYNLYQSFQSASLNSTKKFDSKYFIKEQINKSTHFIISPDKSIDIQDEKKIYEDIEKQIYDRVKFII